jgi:hypothetical protein
MKGKDQLGDLGFDWRIIQVQVLICLATGA